MKRDNNHIFSSLLKIMILVLMFSVLCPFFWGCGKKAAPVPPSNNLYAGGAVGIFYARDEHQKQKSFVPSCFAAKSSNLIIKR